MKFKATIEVDISEENEGLIKVIADSFPVKDETEYEEGVSDLDKAKNHICNTMKGNYKQETFMPIERGSRDYFGIAGSAQHETLMESLKNGALTVDCYFE